MRNLVYWSFIAVQSLYLCTALPAQQPRTARLRTNIELIDSLLTEILQDAEKKMQILPADSLNIMLDDTVNNYQGYLADKTGNFFKDKHYTVFRNHAPSFAFDGLNLLINNFGCSVEYSKPYYKKFLGRSQVRRNIVVHLQGQILKGKLNEITATLDQSAEFQDEVPEVKLPELESSGYYFSRGRRQGYSDWSSFIEPVLAITVVSLIIYLFYTQRS